MIFDKFSGMVERIPEFHNLKSLMDEVKLFYFPAKPQDVLDKEVDVTEYIDNFFLPFPVIAIEDQASLCFLIDTETEQRGLKKPRRFIDIVSLSTMVDNFDPNITGPKELEYYKKYYSQIKQMDLYTVSFGYIEDIIQNSKTKFKFRGETVKAYAIEKNKIVEDVMKTTLGGANEDMLLTPVKNAGVAIQEVLYFNSPSRFVLKESSVKQRKNPKKILRSVDRPIYTMLTPKEIRDRLSLPNPKNESRKTPEAHYRRRHFRTFKSDRFKNMKGKSIVVPATWIGESEKVIGKKKYKVMLEI